MKKVIILSALTLGVATTFAQSQKATGAQNSAPVQNISGAAITTSQVQSAAVDNKVVQKNNNATATDKKNNKATEAKKAPASATAPKTAAPAK